MIRGGIVSDQWYFYACGTYCPRDRRVGFSYGLWDVTILWPVVLIAFRGL